MIFIDYFSKEKSHCNCNASLLALFMKKYSDEIFYLFCSKSHCDCLKKIISDAGISTDRIIFYEIDVYPKRKEYSRFIIDFKLVKQIFTFANKKGETKIFFSYTTTIFLYCLKLFLLFNPKISAITAIHSELERLDIVKYSQGYNISVRFWVILYCILFNLYFPLMIRIKNYKSLLLGESVKKNLIKKIPFIDKNSIMVIDHPTLRKNFCNIEPFQNGKINFGLVGIIDKKKNGENLLELLNYLKDTDFSKFKILLIGHIRNKNTDEYLKNISNFEFFETFSDSLDFISEQQLKELENQVDYNIYTYNIDGYKLTASGAFIDAVTFEKPILAIKNDYLEYYFSKYGNIGYLFDNPKDMAQKIIDISNNPNIEEYTEQKENIKKIKQVIDINYIADNNDFFM